GTSEHEKLCRARDQCRDILKYVNEAVKQAENRHRLEGYQKRLDATSLERTSNPLAAEFKELSPPAPAVGCRTADLHVLLLEDLLVLLQKQDEKLVLKCHSKTALGSSDNKQTFSPVLKLNSVLIRSVATDKRALFIICTSELGPQIYELVALTSSEKNTWMEVLEEAVQSSMRNATFPPKRRTPEPTRAAPSSLVLPDADVSPILSRGSGSAAEAEESSSADDNPAELLGQEKPPALPEEPQSSEVEEEEEEEEPGRVSGALLEPTTRLALPVPLSAEGLAEAALEDVENLRLLLLRRLLPSRDAEPEDDLTPTPSVSGGAQAWDSVLSSQDSASQEALAEPPAPPEEPKPRAGWEETSETGPAAEEPGSYKVVRKGRGLPPDPPLAPPRPGWGAGTRGPPPTPSRACSWLPFGCSLPARSRFVGLEMGARGGVR
ncbi:rho guanine nucleotide exchange factor 11-like, partial [Oxyura jamaicensis]|uniref:rho guanine nucleotide exchange factor 11-like n=1 Tax=Oxyura jamaicensis TaxID=8884 RepID=UPI0015A57C44